MVVVIMVVATIAGGRAEGAAESAEGCSGDRGRCSDRDADAEARASCCERR